MRVHGAHERLDVMVQSVQQAVGHNSADPQIASVAHRRQQESHRHVVGPLSEQILVLGGYGEPQGLRVFYFCDDTKTSVTIAGSARTSTDEVGHLAAGRLSGRYPFDSATDPSKRDASILAGRWIPVSSTPPRHLNYDGADRGSSPLRRPRSTSERCHGTA